MSQQIYVIEDDEDLREVITWALTKEGFTARSFGGADAALKVLFSGKAEPPKLIILDQVMDGMTGADFLRIKSDAPGPLRGCPVFLISAAPLAVPEGKVEDESWTFMPKPLDLQNLVSSVNRLLA